MKHAVALFALVIVILMLGYQQAGYTLVYMVSYGVICIMAVLISATFLWLWRMRATPLALGMAFSWTGSALVLGWWWLYTLLGRPAGMADHPILFVFLAFYISGAILHFGVIQGSFNLPRFFFLLPAAFALVLSTVAAMTL